MIIYLVKIKTIFHLNVTVKYFLTEKGIYVLLFIYIVKTLRGRAVIAHRNVQIIQTVQTSLAKRPFYVPINSLSSQMLY